jgi:hypothetical protein
MVHDRAPVSACLDLRALAGAREWLERYESTTREVGTWHTHPTAPGQPSEADLSVWLSGLDFLSAYEGVSRYANLILTPSRDAGWRRPEIHAWVVRRTDWGGAICEPANVELRYDVPRAVPKKYEYPQAEEPIVEAVSDIWAPRGRYVRRGQLLPITDPLVREGGGTSATLPAQSNPRR